MRRPVFYDRLRLGFLVFTLVWIGWLAQAQLSVVNVLAFLSALRTDFRWDYFLMAPLIFILWFAAAASLLFWNRGAYCGWLCPFRRPAGTDQSPCALPENSAAEDFLWRPSAFDSAEIHHLSGAVRHFAERSRTGRTHVGGRAVQDRDHPAVSRANGHSSCMRERWSHRALFVERAFCRYLCPMGAALAIPARLRLFDWLRRYRECGVPCQRCGNECPVQAIHPEGHINPNECIQCLHCQMLYHHDQKCPVMIQRRLKRERHSASSGAGASHAPLPPKTKVSAQGVDQNASS